MKFLAITCTVLLFSFVASGQESENEISHDSGHLTCAQNKMTELYFAGNPEAAERAEQERLEFLRRLREGVSIGNRDADYIVPVVFHIVHANGSENISEAQINSAIDVLNEDFSASTPDVDNVQPAFADLVGNPNVEFRLAKLDPDGNCTNGINRVYNPQTNAGGDNVKTGDAATWGRTKYLNIWVVNNIEGSAAGYAYLPWGGAPVEVDGIIIEDAYVGRIGTGNDTRSHALSHEAGHWAGLFHTWGFSDTPGLAENCDEDDGIPDTPETIGWNNCDLDGESCGSLDNVENFMDYSYCYKMFTEDQAGIMGEVLNNGPSGRYLLNSATNLANTGVLAPDVICLADFTTEENTFCEGETITFTDLSFNGVTSWEWTFEGGDANSTEISNPEVAYLTPGTYDVTLTVSNDNGSETVTKTNFINVLPIGENDVPFQEGFESFSSLENNGENWFVTNSQDSNIQWELTSDAAYSGNKSVFVNGRINSNGEVESLISPTYDLSTINSDLDEEVHISFKYAHARRSIGSDDVLKVMVSRNCGESWATRKTIDIDSLPTVSGNVQQVFVPDSQEEWQEVIVDNVISTYLTDEFRVKFEFTSVNGNNIYLDDINIYNSSEGPLSVRNISFASEIILYPNPSRDMSILEYNLEKSVDIQIDVLDLSGRVVSEIYDGNQLFGSQRINIPSSQFARGVYFIRLTSEGEQFITKLIRQ